MAGGLMLVIVLAVVACLAVRSMDKSRRGR